MGRQTLLAHRRSQSGACQPRSAHNTPPQHVYLSQQVLCCPIVTHFCASSVLPALTATENGLRRMGCSSHTTVRLGAASRLDESLRKARRKGGTVRGMWRRLAVSEPWGQAAAARRRCQNDAINVQCHSNPPALV